MHKKRIIVIALLLSVCTLFGCGEPSIEESTALIGDMSKEGILNIEEIPNLKEMLYKEPLTVSVHEDTIKVEGLSRPYEIIMVADSHISLCDDRDAALIEKAAKRYKDFTCWDGEGADKAFEECIKYVKREKPDVFLLAGDIIDSAMEASIDFLRNQLAEIDVPYLYGTGNHDFEYGTEYFSEEALNTYLPRLNEITDTDKGYQTLELEEITVMVVDDGSNKVSPDTLEELDRIFAIGKPVVIALHVPLEPLAGYSDELWNRSKQIWGQNDYGHSRVLLGSRSCNMDETTLAFVNKIMDPANPVELVMAGHIHFYHKDSLTNELIQVTAGPGYNKEISKVILTP